MTKFILLFAMVVALALPVVPSVSHAQVSPALARKAPDAAEMLDAAGKRGHVRIIAEFTGPVPANQLTPDPARLAPMMQHIASMQDAIVATHFGSAANPRPGQGFPRGLMRFEIRPMFAVNVSTTELGVLASDPRIVHIHLDRLDAPSLLQSVPLIGMPGAYIAGATGSGQAVAIIDTGVQPNHEFLATKVVMEACFSNSGGGGGGLSLCPNGTPSQTGAGAADPTTGNCINAGTQLCGHGTHVAGIAAGNNTNPGGGKPNNGVAKGADIVAVQVFTLFTDAPTCIAAGTTAPCVLATVSDQISALDWVFMNALTPAAGVKLASANMSLGGGMFTAACDGDTRKGSIDSLRGAGVATAIAAGNSGFINAVGAPGCISTAVTVGSADKNDVISSFTNIAPMVALMGPGGFGGGSCAFGSINPDILSSVAGNAPAVTGNYACFAGTSQATPHVAGAFAAIRTACPSATVDQILTALQNTGKPITDTRAGGTLTKPRIQVDAALQQLCITASDLAITKTAPATATAGSSFSYTINVTNNGPSNATTVVVTDPLPAGIAFVSSSPVACTGAPNLSCTIGSLANGASSSFSITVNVPANFAPSTISNTASVKADQLDLNPGNNMFTASTLVSGSADLALTKTCTSTASVNSSCDITITNLGPSDAQAVMVTDAITSSGNNFTVTSVSGAACTPAPPVGPVTSTTLMCNLGTVAASATGIVHVTFTSVNHGTVSDTATVTSTTPDPNAGNNSGMGSVTFRKHGLRG